MEEKLQGLFMIETSVINTAKNDNLYFHLKLTIPGKDIFYDNVKKFKDDDMDENEFKEIFSPGRIIGIKKATYSEKYSYTIKDFYYIGPKISLRLTENRVQKLCSKIDSCIHKIKNDNLRNFIENLFDKYRIEFQNSPAAQSHHHCYFGGLLQHTCECLHIAEILLKQYPKIDKDVVFAACILHDFAKIWEYDLDDNTGIITKNKDFEKRWINHSQWGYSTCMCKTEETGDNIFAVVAKMIATHHSRSEWGALIDLNTSNLESIYYLLHHIDDLSAKFGEISILDACKNITRDFENICKNYLEQQQTEKQASDYFNNFIPSINDTSNDIPF